MKHVTSRKKHVRKRRKPPSVQPMVVTLAGSFSEIWSEREDVLGPKKRRRQSPIVILADGERVVLLVTDAKTSKATHRLVIDSAESLIAALHALETISHMR